MKVSTCLMREIVEKVIGEMPCIYDRIDFETQGVCYTKEETFRFVELVLREYNKRRNK